MKKLLTLILPALALTAGAPQAADATRYGAIAIDENKTNYPAGISVRQPKQLSAKNKALSECEADGGVNCGIVLWSSNHRCGAVAVEVGDAFGVGFADSKETAEKVARAKCEKEAISGWCNLKKSKCEKKEARAQAQNLREQAQRAPAPAPAGNAGGTDNQQATEGYAPDDGPATEQARQQADLGDNRGTTFDNETIKRRFGLGDPPDYLEQLKAMTDPMRGLTDPAPDNQQATEGYAPDDGPATEQARQQADLGDNRGTTFDNETIKRRFGLGDPPDYLEQLKAMTDPMRGLTDPAPDNQQATEGEGPDNDPDPSEGEAPEWQYPDQAGNIRLPLKKGNRDKNIFQQHSEAYAKLQEQWDREDYGEAPGRQAEHQKRQPGEDYGDDPDQQPGEDIHDFMFRMDNAARARKAAKNYVWEADLQASGSAEIMPCRYYCASKVKIPSGKVCRQACENAIAEAEKKTKEQREDEAHAVKAEQEWKDKREREWQERKDKWERDQQARAAKRQEDREQAAQKLAQRKAERQAARAGSGSGQNDDGGLAAHLKMMDEIHEQECRKFVNRTGPFNSVGECMKKMEWQKRQVIEDWGVDYSQQPDSNRDIGRELDEYAARLAAERRRTAQQQARQTRNGSASSTTGGMTGQAGRSAEDPWDAYDRERGIRCNPGERCETTGRGRDSGRELTHCEKTSPRPDLCATGTK